MILLLMLAQDFPTIGADEFAERRADLAKRAGAPVIVPCEELYGGEPGIDMNTPLYDFDYLTGLREPGSILVVTSEGSLLFTDAKVKFDKTRPRAEFEAFVKEVYSQGDTAQVRQFGSMKTTKAVREALDAHGIDLGRDAGKWLSNMRVIKSAAEIKMMKAVTDQTNAAHIAAMKGVKPGMNESELQKIIEDTFAKHGGTGLGFPSIVGSGKNGTILHYMANNQEIGKNVMIVCDIGSGYHGYSSDVTRTIPSDGKFDDDEREIYQCVLDAQKAAEKILKPGVSWRDLDAAAAGLIKERGLTKWSYSHSQDGGVRHGLGHYVGLSVHDSGSYGVPLAEGMCITIEPGIYDKDKKIGVRIEDIYMVTKDGYLRLSEGAPREIDEIEKLMSGK